MNKNRPLEMSMEGANPKRRPGRPRKQPTKTGEGANGVFLALDFGNDRTKLAYVDGEGQIRPISDPDGMNCTPSFVAYEAGNPNRTLCGQSAKNHGRIHSEYTCSYAKRMRGQGSVPAFVDFLGNPVLTSALEVELVKWRLAHAEQILGRPILGVLVTVPAHFDSEQRRVSLAMVEEAGYPTLGVINEPTAALLPFAKDKAGIRAVFDLGGGTFDISILEFCEGNVVNVLASQGQEALAGKECTARLFEYCLNRAAQAGCAIDPAIHTREATYLLDEVEKAKMDLSTQERTIISFNTGGRLIDVEITRADFEALIPDLLESIETLTRDSLCAAKLQPEQVSGIVLAGGACRMPCIQRLAADIFGPEKVLRNVDPDLAVVLGACEAIGTKVYERVAAGDLVLPDNDADLVLPEVIQLREILGQALGVLARRLDTGRDIMAPILEQGTSLPENKTSLFGLITGDRHNCGANIRVLQGNDFDRPDEDLVLAEFELTGLPPGPVKERIEICFSVDTDGLVEVRAEDTHSGMEIRGRADARGAIGTAAKP